MLSTSHIGNGSPGQDWLDRLQREVRVQKIIDAPGYRVIPGLHGSQLVLDNNGRAAAESGRIHQAVVREIHDDHLVCRLRTSTRTSDTFYVAKPWALRKSSYEGEMLWDSLVTYDEDGLSRTLTRTVQGTTGADKQITITQTMVPGYLTEGQVVLADPPARSIILVSDVVEGSGLLIDNEGELVAVQWADINADGRRFENPLVPYKLCQNGAVVDAFFVAGEPT